MLQKHVRVCEKFNYKKSNWCNDQKNTDCQHKLDEKFKILLPKKKNANKGDKKDQLKYFSIGE